VLLCQGAWSATPLVGVVRWATDRIFRLIVQFQLFECRVCGAWEQWVGSGGCFVMELSSILLVVGESSVELEGLVVVAR
jgi:hypothetical protein